MVEIRDISQSARVPFQREGRGLIRLVRRCT